MAGGRIRRPHELAPDPPCGRRDRRGRHRRHASPPAFLVGTSIAAPSPDRIALYALAGRFVSFVLIYGLLFGVAVAVGRRGLTSGDGATDGSETTDGDGVTVLATGVVGAVAYLVASAALLLVLDPSRALTNAIAGFGSSVGVGVPLAVVAFAGLAPADRLYYL